MKKARLGILLPLLFSISTILGNERRPIDPQRLDQSIEKLRAQQREERGEIKKMLDEHRRFERLDPRWDEMIEEFQGDALGQFFRPDNFQKFLEKFRPHQHLQANDSQWMETPTERIFILKLSTAPGASKDAPLDIQVTKSSITINATIEEKTQRQDERGNHFSAYAQRRFSQIIPVPADCDGERAVVEQKDGEIWIKIPKKAEK